MHYAKHASRSGSLDDSSHEGLDRQSRVKASDLGFEVPDHILPDIIPISDPKLVYANVHAQRDRRLRLLIRRYTNQIQHGCRNVNCTTPTCLSYRKRNSTGPLRRYTDLSARTLACQLVEEYTRGGKDSVAGLCQNQPVVPWYEDPDVTKRRRNSIEKPPHQRRENAAVSKTASPTQRTKEPLKVGLPIEHPPQRPSQDGVVQAGRRLRTLDISKNDEDIAEEITGVLNSISCDESGNAASEPGTDIHTNDDIHRQSPAEAKPRDIASFTQTLFDMLPLRLLSWLPGRESLQPTKPAKSADDSTTHQQDNVVADDVHADSPPEESHSVPGQSAAAQQARSTTEEHHGQAYTLRTLTWTTIPWLRSFQTNDNLEASHKQFLVFLKQSFVYCFSDPERLIRTIKDLQESYGTSSMSTGPRTKFIGPAYAHPKMDSQLMARPVLAPYCLCVAWPKIRTYTEADMTALLFSLAFIDSFKYRELILNSIFTALQHCYRLPSWLQRRQRKQSRSASGSAERGSTNLRELPEPHSTSELFPDDLVGLTELQDDEERLAPLNDAQIAELCLVALVLIASLVFGGRSTQAFGGKEAFAGFTSLRNSGLAHSRWPKARADAIRDRASDLVGLIIDAIDVCDDWSVLRVLVATMDIISHRLTVAKWEANMNCIDSPKAKKTGNKTIVDLLIDRFDRRTLGGWDRFEEKSSWIGTAVVELVRTVMLKNWDRRPIIQRTGPVGGALELLAGIYRERRDLNLESTSFHMPFIADSFDEMAMPIEWMAFRADARQMHLLSFSFLFEPATLVRYFRAINIEMMRKSHESATMVYNDTRHYMWAPAIPVYEAREVLASLRPHMAKYFVLTIRRDDVLNDAINQIWRRQRRELMRPLRVRLGKDEGEDGLDHGGVQQEFFRVVFAEAFRPDYGMFTVDSTTRMTWFQPGSFEPLYRFEALGVLMSIAIYNGITLPITFPLAFYRKLLGLKVKTLEHISDGWPDLTRGLRSLLEWTDGDVGDVIARTYEFSYDLCGSTVSVDMHKVGHDDPWPPTPVGSSALSSSSSSRKGRGKGKGKGKAKSTSFELPIEPSLTPPVQPCSPDLHPTVVPILNRTPSMDIKGMTTPSSIDSDLLEEEAALVTNANRDQYVKDYILWLTHKSIEPQFEAFAKGFYTCLDRTALSIFTPEALKAVIEGHPEINIDELERTATYDDYERHSPTIVNFWHVVRNFSPDQHRQLLEFVTASDRVPVNGLASIQFIVQKNGDDDSRLPSSSTCYGRLLLPQYSSREILEEKLAKAIENSVGFGTL
ncbi:hypothetical protein A1O1_00485 [Capronia coronata CBS 617.96]|uniref:HECT-type E3 ubiquitin transferase n=1 Tax=Capronia coronata CBS 617.96 TaxID=1182541 RepID=W9ZLL5_9EURO|nr:uncharacterized protein A1O1_00485 [Capronia coronata CBS 617.96]EXJ95364.1 hypothetical protein A1O1_00485 [Capronia coronata CBS 617.96]